MEDAGKPITVIDHEKGRSVKAREHASTEALPNGIRRRSEAMKALPPKA